jgi:putative RNA 2'-phosphotransferase
MTPFVPYEFDAERFSRWMSYVLRHNPARYGLQPDRHGYVDLESFLTIAQRRYPGATAEQLRDLIQTGPEGRFELSGGRLRARYGHSIPIEPAGPAVAPPAKLYHGVDAARLDSLLAEGLSPASRQMVHLSESAEEALHIAQRRLEHPAVLGIRALEAHQAGVVFFREGRVYLTRHVPASFLSVEPIPIAPDPSPQ